MSKSGTTSIALANPIRYRGYYYDDETGLYYLNARYYSPMWRRFISPDDSAYLDPESINGLNLYCYCNNDPINKFDPTGHFPWLILAAVSLLTPVAGLALQAVTSIACYVGMFVASIWDEDVRKDMSAIGWNPFNRDETAVINSKKVSFYKGVPVFRTNMKRSGSFVAIFLNSNVDTTDVKHEYGHNIQQMLMGPVKFGMMIGLPSWLEWSNKPYYERPWEITADVFGGVTTRQHNPKDISRGYWYLAVSGLLGLLGYLFLFGEY